MSDPSEFICSSAIAERHTAFIDALHRIAAIHPISPEKIDWTPAVGGRDSIPAVRGILERLENGLKAESLEKDFLLSFPELFAPSNEPKETGPMEPA